MVRAMQTSAGVDRNSAREAAVRAAERVAELNVERDDKFQDTAMGEMRLAFEAFRPDVEADLPDPGQDRLFDALTELTRELDASPETVSIACDRVLDLAGRPKGRRTERAATPSL